MAKLCAFCTETAVEKGGEHIWDDWISRAQPKKSLYRARKRYAIDSPTIEYDTAHIDEKLPVVCEPCNSGWMPSRRKRRYATLLLGSRSDMASHPKSPAKNPTGDFNKFTNFMQRLVAVPHSEIKAKLDAEKQAKQLRKKRPSSRASASRSEKS
jgi:hypothetical protein